MSNYTQRLMDEAEQDYHDGLISYSDLVELEKELDMLYE